MPFSYIYIFASYFISMLSIGIAIYPVMFLKYVLIRPSLFFENVRIRSVFIELVLLVIVSASILWGAILTNHLPPGWVALLSILPITFVLGYSLAHKYARFIIDLDLVFSLGLSVLFVFVFTYLNRHGFSIGFSGGDRRLVDPITGRSIPGTIGVVPALPIISLLPSLLFSKKVYSKRWSYIIVSIGCLFANLYLLNRIGIASIAFSLLLIIITYGVNINKTRITQRHLLIACMVPLLILSAFMLEPIQNVIATYNNREFGTPRHEIWLRALQQVPENYLGGMHFDYDSDAYAHNTFIDMINYCGVVGGLAFFMFFLIVCFRVRNKIKSVVLCIAGFGVAFMFEPILFGAPIMIELFVLLSGYYYERLSIGGK